MYNKVNESDVLYFINLLGKDNVLLDGEINESYAKDEMGNLVSYPEIVLLARTTFDVSNILKYANEKHIPVTTRGSGTGLVGSCVPLHGGIVLDMSKMNKILKLDEDNLTLIVEPGVLLLDIYDYVESRGYFYAPDPGEKTATIGGNISTNAGGMRAVKYGTTRDWVKCLEVVLANGDVIMVGRNVVKDSNGYSLKHLIIGSEGTLAVVTKAYLKLIKKPNLTTSLLVPFTQVEDAIKAVPSIIKLQLDTIAVEFFVKNILKFSEDYLGKKFPSNNYNAYLLLTFEGDTKEDLDKSIDKASTILLNDLNALDALIVDTKERKDMVWSTRGAFLEAIKSSSVLMDECDVVVPISEVAKFILYTYSLESKYNVRIPLFGHAGDGNLHIYICQDNNDIEQFNKVVSRVFDDLYKQAKKVGGLASGEHGIGYLKKEYLKDIIGNTEISLMKGIKQVFDPNNILNPDKII